MNLNLKLKRERPVELKFWCHYCSAAVSECDDSPAL